MSYIEKSLGAGEKIVATAELHWWYGFFAWIILIVSAAIPAYVWANYHNRFVRYASLAILALGIIKFLSRMAKKWAMEIGVTSHRVVRKAGILSLHTDEIALHNIEGVRISQGLWGRMLGYGTIRIEGTGVDAIDIETITNPLAFRAAIETARGTDQTGKAS